MIVWMVQNNDAIPPMDTFFTDGFAARYALCVGNGALSQIFNGMIGNHNPYGYICKTGTTIDMMLDFDNLTLSFRINNKDCGKAFDILKDRYKAAVYMYNKG
eukprot:291195_1